jgi:hypothetical protein
VRQNVSSDRCGFTVTHPGILKRFKKSCEFNREQFIFLELGLIARLVFLGVGTKDVVLSEFKQIIEKPTTRASSPGGTNFCGFFTGSVCLRVCICVS